MMIRTMTKNPSTEAQCTAQTPKFKLNPNVTQIRYFQLTVCYRVPTDFKEKIQEISRTLSGFTKD